VLSVLAHLLNFALSLLIWLIIGRYVLRLIVGQRENFVTELFRRATEPAFRVLGRIAPPLVGTAYIPILTILALVAVRLALLPVLR
jgi:uncharacterized protein YggT (Ycf19 family)